jgi:urease accessory protein
MFHDIMANSTQTRTMPRATAVRIAADCAGNHVIDRVILDADERYRRRLVLTGVAGTTFLLDLPQAVALRHGDGLVLEDGSIVLVEGRPEALIEIAADNPSALARLAWHLGNRHTDVQVTGERLRIRHDHVLEDMLTRLGARLARVEAPFEPESGAYDAQSGAKHDHDHHHDHSRGHSHHPDGHD